MFGHAGTVGVKRKRVLQPYGVDFLARRSAGRTKLGWRNRVKTGVQGCFWIERVKVVVWDFQQ
ncbi:MAG UNVERIFIED_CONTAM: hypothetical protein LVR18_33185 [Planctomycetaceae bacterium]